MKKLPLLLAAALFVPALVLHGQSSRRFQVHEATIARLEQELKTGRLTCHALVDQYLRRIEAYDKKGPALNAIVQLNPDALKEAEDLDRRFKASGPAGPLHCVPMIVKDNFETIGLQSAAGSLAMKGFGRPWDEATLIRLAYSYEQATHHRHPPPSTPPVR